MTEKCNIFALATACEKAWIYERVPGFELAGYDDRIEKAVLTRKKCQELCLQDTKLPCRSAEYDYTTFTCRLSRETRRSQPAAYRATTEDVDYLENQCADARSFGVCDYQEYPGQDLGFGDLQITTKDKETVRFVFVFDRRAQAQFETDPHQNKLSRFLRPKSIFQCQKRCDETTAFVCRSLTYFPSTSVCRLSGDDNLSAGPTAVATRRGANYYQKAPCVDCKYLCD